MKPKISMKKYMNELSKMTGEEMLKEYLAKVMPVYMVMVLVIHTLLALKN